MLLKSLILDQHVIREDLIEEKLLIKFNQRYVHNYIFSDD
jgi:hypothetical protein